MAILTKHQLKELHVTMMGFGAKVVKGYSLNDYNYTAPMMDKRAEDYTPQQIRILTKILCKYRNTQLKEYKRDLEETLNYYSSKS